MAPNSHMIGGTIYARGSIRAHKLATAYAQGTGAFHQVMPEMRGAPHAFYGVRDDKMLDVFNKVKASGEPWLYVDNGYFTPDPHGFRLYSIEVGAMRYAGPIESTKRGRLRWERLQRPKIKPWRKRGYHVLIALQSPYWYAKHGLDWRAWMGGAEADALTYTGLKPVIRYKPGAPYNGVLRSAQALHKDFSGAAAVITHSSLVSVEAVLAGIPAFADCYSPTRLLGFTDRAQMKNPPRPGNRLEWAHTLAGRQWTLEEIANGEFVNQLSF